MESLLLIEDDENVADLVRRMLAAAGIKPNQFKCVKMLDAGIAAAEADRPDLILMDLTLPPLNERETLSEGVGRLARIAPLIVMTGSADPSIVFDCQAAGAQACLLKQNILAAKCGVETLAQTIIQATLNWKREHAPKT